MSTEPVQGFNPGMFFRAATRKMFPKTLTTEGQIDLVYEQPYSQTAGPEWSPTNQQLSVAGQQMMNTLGAGSDDMGEIFRDLWSKRTAPELQRQGYLDTKMGALREVGATPVGAVNGVPVWAVPQNALGSASGQYDADTGTIQIPAKPITEGISSTADIRYQVPIRTLAHELQHAGTDEATGGQLLTGYTPASKGLTPYRNQWQEVLARGVGEGITRTRDVDRTGMEAIFDQLQGVLNQAAQLPTAPAGTPEFQQTQRLKGELSAKRDALTKAYWAEQERAALEARNTPMVVGQNDTMRALVNLLNRVYGGQ